MVARKRWVGLLLALVGAIGPAPGVRASDAPSAEEIMQRFHEAMFYAGRDMKAKVSMRLVNRQGQERGRTMTMLRANASDGRNQKYYIYFHQPADVRGTAFLVWKYPDKDDDRWLHIPAIHLTTRVAAKDRQSSFVGSDFTYEDISGRDVGLDRYELLREESLGDKACYVVESTPKETSVQARKVSWIDKTTFLPLKEESYDPRGRVLKVFTAEEIRPVKGRPTIVRRTMRDVQSDHYTEVVFESVDYDVGLEDGLFAERYLEKPPGKWIH
ncbi:MAG: outer membrane lipoprotein-sorting protein [Nitrospirae bacterium]|nr:outer membrane lipoprotein-sorting protein [Nitrospirota bacterium]